MSASLGCLNSCGPGDQSCVNGCKTAAKRPNSTTLGVAGTNSGCFNLDNTLDFECAFSECASELTACFDFEVPEMALGPKNFSPVKTTVNRDRDCLRRDQTSAIGFGAYENFISCADDAGALT